MTNNPDNNQFYEDQYTAIRAARQRGDLDGVARLITQTAQESEGGLSDLDGALRSLNAAGKRIKGA